MRTWIIIIIIIISDRGDNNGSLCENGNIPSKKNVLLLITIEYSHAVWIVHLSVCFASESPH